MGVTQPLDVGQLSERAAQILSTLVRIPTVSRPEGRETDEDAFGRHVRAMEESFPRLTAACERHTVGAHGQLWRWPGTDPSRAVVLMAHQDVVPAQETDGWSGDPFSGLIADGRVHWRGTLDDKGDLVCTLLGAETLLEQGFAPAVDVWFVLGDNEETAGGSAQEAVDLLRQRGVAPELVLDEGGAVASDVFPGVHEPLAMVGLGEKGLLSVRLVASSTGGHASAPPPLGAVERIARAIQRLRKHPFPASFHPVTQAMLRTLGEKADGAVSPALRLAAAAGPAGAALLARMGGEAAALVRTTVAATELSGADGHNVLAARASVVLNLRLAPGTTVAQALARLRRVVRDRQIEWETLESNEPSPVSPADGAPFEALRAALAQSHPGVHLTPYVVMAATDARRFHAISERVYRFAPLRMGGAERASIHGTDESVAVDDLGPGVLFYRSLLGAYR